jgi:hypothetical protein
MNLTIYLPTYYLVTCSVYVCLFVLDLIRFFSLFVSSCVEDFHDQFLLFTLEFLIIESVARLGSFVFISFRT